MPRYTVTPWKSHADLLQVRQQLYPSSSSSGHVQLQRDAVNRVMAWKLRGNLPHAVESTALLLDAVLHHDPRVNSSFSIRAVYSAAFCRFVTGFCDIGRNRERALEPSSMLEIAKQIGMPPEFVALRHEATHEELPGLQRLQDATRKALNWLWQVYWSRLSDQKDSRAVTEDASVKKEIATELRMYRKVAREGLVNKKRQSNGERSALADSTCERLVSACKSERQLTAAVTGLLVEGGLLLPADRELGSSLDGSYLLWDPLISRLQRHLRIDFTCDLGLALLQGVTGSSALRREVDANKEALAGWVVHLVHGPEAREKNEDQFAAEVMKHCCLYPSHWTRVVAQGTLAACSGVVRDEWSSLVQASFASSDEDQASVGVVDGEMGSKIAQTPSSFLEAEKADSWTREILPPSVPLGVVK